MEVDRRRECNREFYDRSIKTEVGVDAERVELGRGDTIFGVHSKMNVPIKKGNRGAGWQRAGERGTTTTGADLVRWERSCVWGCGRSRRTNVKPWMRRGCAWECIDVTDTSGVCICVYLWGSEIIRRDVPEDPSERYGQQERVAEIWEGLGLKWEYQIRVWTALMFIIHT